MSALFYGSISTIADTSELQRLAFNQAFEAHGLDWNWERDEYRAMLGKSGGADRIADYAQSRGETVDATAVHASKSQLFQMNLATAEVTLRPGVLDTIVAARGGGWKVGFVTTTSSENVSALLDALGPDLKRDDFDVIVDSSKVEANKPDKAAYAFALQQLGESPEECIAIEDNADGVRSATAAGVRCMGFPNENTAGLDLAGAEQPTDMGADLLQQFMQTT